MRRLVVALCVACVAVGPADAGGPTTEGTPVALRARDQVAVRRAVTASLKDPASATFGGMHAKPATSGVGLVVCGRVNAKNSYGGFTGMTYFLGALLRAGTPDVKFLVAGIGDHARDVCTDEGLSVGD